LASACGVTDKLAPGRDKVDYKKSRTIDNLEVPPDLSSETINDPPRSLDAASTTWSDVGATQPLREQTAVLPAQAAVEVKRDGDQQWLLVRGSPEQVWPRVKEFWLQEGFLIRKEDPRTGILETDWAENRADIPQGPIRGVIGKALDAVYSSATRDKYRVRLEKGDVDTTEVYLTHRGVEEVVRGDAVDETTVWQSRPTDPELEAEMLKRLMVYLGVQEQRAQAMLARQTEKQVRAQLVTDSSGSSLLVREDFSRAWRRTGVALDRIGFTVEDRDRSGGTYYVRYNDPLGEQDESGLLSKLAFWSSDDGEASDQYRIKLVADGSVTYVVVNNSEDQRDTTTTGKRILTLLEEQLR
ncbi:MAG: outer membrane protein assembly factor BamC, partial [Thiohalobacterales bacterium]|nr:outer membrane protein assembly factor BamC [Thiohalobacterales bacterium]